MRKLIHRAASRGFVDYGGVRSYHSFPFGDFEEAMLSSFGALGVLNDDVLPPGGGVGAHPHDNWEMLWLVLQGELTHCDDLGNRTVLQAGEAQILSAGNGVWHAERNQGNQDVHTLQIWMQPNLRDTTPRYQKQSSETPLNRWQTIAAPLGDDEKALGWQQNAWLSRAKIERGVTVNYEKRGEENSFYLFVLKGEVYVAGEVLGQRDALGISSSRLRVVAREESVLLLLEVPGVHWESGAPSAPEMAGGHYAELEKQSGRFGRHRTESGRQLQRSTTQ